VAEINTPRPKQLGCSQGCSANQMVWERNQKIAILKQLPTHFEAKHKKHVGTPFPRVLAPLHPWLL